jgi:hypothetical protein
MINEIAGQIFSEIKSLRSEISFLVPAETLDEYENADEILSAYEDASKEFDSPSA